MSGAIVELLGGRVGSEAQDATTTDASESTRAGDEQEAKGLHCQEPVDSGTFASARSMGRGSRRDLAMRVANEARSLRGAAVRGALLRSCAPRQRGLRDVAEREPVMKNVSRLAEHDPDLRPGLGTLRLSAIQ